MRSSTRLSTLRHLAGTRSTNSVAKSSGRHSGRMQSRAVKANTAPKRLQRSAQPLYRAPLEIRSSSLKVTGGAGLGVYAVGRGNSKVVFRKNQKIQDITGGLAMRLIRPEGNLEWLYHKGKYCPMKKATHVVWANRAIPVAGEETLDFGTRPDDLSLYINDSGPDHQDNVKIESEFDNTLKAHKGTLSEADLPCYYLTAVKTIRAGDELLWSYSGNGKDETDYDCGYQKKSLRTADTSAIRSCVKDVFGGQPKLKLVKDTGEFDRQRCLDELAPKPCKAVYTMEEQPLAREIKAPCGRTKEGFLEARPSRLAMNVYLKSRLAEGPNVKTVLENTRTVFRVKFTWKSRFGLISPFGLDNLYAYCVNNNLIVPEHDPGSIPLGWLGGHLKASPGDPYYIGLLKKRLQYTLARPKICRKLFLKNLNDFIPNPLRKSGKWQDFDPEILANFAVNDAYNNGGNKKAIADYRRNKRGSAPKVNDLARRGNVEAIKAIVERRVRDSSRLGEVAAELHRKGIKLVLGADTVKSDDNTIEAFIREHFKEKVLQRMLGIRMCSSRDLLRMVEDPRATDEFGNAYAGKEICRRIRAHNDKELLKKYIQFHCRKGRVSSEILQRLRLNSIKAGRADYTRESVLKLFGPSCPDNVRAVFTLKRKNGSR